MPQHPVGFADIVAKVKPAVISVRVKMEQARQLPGSARTKFRFRLARRLSASSSASACRTAARVGHQVITGQGSGFFITADGYAVTNNHVVQNAENVQVTTDDGKIYTAKVIGTDPRTDLALIKVDGKDFPYVKLADATPRIGDWVLAVGNPFGLGGTVTAGIVSARGRDIGAGPYDDFIQIDAPVNKGNSGGPDLRRRRQCHWRQHGDLLAVRRLGRHCLRYSGRNGEERGRAVARQGQRHARMDRRANPAGDARNRR